MLKQNRINISFVTILSLLCIDLSFVNSQDLEILCSPSTVQETVDLNNSWLFQWDPASDQSVSPDNPANIGVLNGEPPYSWEVLGGGFYLAEDETEGLANTLFADDTACGIATITVADAYGKIATGHVRSSNGKWSGYTLAARVSSRDVCWNESCTHVGQDVKCCEGIDSRYQYYRQACTRGSAYGSGPFCNDDPQPDCVWPGNACELTVTDGICSVTLNVKNYHGIAWIELYRREWICK